MSDGPFEVGEQPCPNFTEEWEGALYNRHECIHRPCDKIVAFCQSCLRDHHEGGAGTCACRKDGTARREPRP